MARNGSGGYALPINGWNPAVNGVSATPADWQALIDDVAAAIQASIAADGQTPMTGNLQMGGYRLTGAGAPSGAGQSLRWEQLTRGADIPSAPTIAIPLEGQLFAVTGSTAITAINATIAGRLVYLKFDAGIVLTHSASLLMPSGVSVTTGADDIAVFVSVSAGVWRCISYPRFESANYPSATEPTITWPLMTWADTGNMLLKRRNAAGTAWVTLGPLLTEMATLAQLNTNRMVSITSNQNFTVPAGVTQIFVDGCAGGGGGGAGGNSTSGGGGLLGAPGGGGGAGQNTQGAAITVVPGNTYAVAIGAGGSAGSNGPTAGGAGGNGGNTQFGALLTLLGGDGGAGGVQAASQAGPTQGGSGYPAAAYSNTSAAGAPNTGWGSSGASGPFGGGGAGGVGGSATATQGGAAGGYGAGGGGGGGIYAANGNNGAIGGAGSPGILIIRW